MQIWWFQPFHAFTASLSIATMSKHPNFGPGKCATTDSHPTTNSVFCCCFGAFVFDLFFFPSQYFLFLTASTDPQNHRFRQGAGLLRRELGALQQQLSPALLTCLVACKTRGCWDPNGWANKENPWVTRFFFFFAFLPRDFRSSCFWAFCCLGLLGLHLLLWFFGVAGSF